TRVMRGFSPSAIAGAAAGPLNRTTEVFNPVVALGTYYRTNTSRMYTVGTLASNQTLTLPVTWGATERTATGLSLAEISLAARFGVTVTFFSNGTQFAQLTSPDITTVLNAGLL